MPEFKKFLLIGMTFTALSVLFGAHGLKNTVIEAKLIASFQTSARYQFYHALGFLMTAAWITLFISAQKDQE